MVPYVQGNVRMEKLCAMLGFSREMTERLVVKKEAMKCSGKIYSEQHRRNFNVKDDIFRVENDPDDESRLNLTINRKPIADGNVNRTVQSFNLSFLCSNIILNMSDFQIFIRK